MAFVEPDKEKELGADGQPVSTGPESGSATLGGEGGGGASGNAAAAAEPAAPSGAPQGQFVGIKQYLDANKPQSQKLANNVGGYVGELGQNVRDSVGSQTGLYNQAVDANTVNVDQPLFDEAKTNTAGVAADQNKLSSFQKMRDATYKGPTDFQTSEFYKPTDDALKKAQQAGQNSQTEQGQRTLINQYQQEKTGKTGGAGTTNFDQMLLQSGGGKQALAKARDSQADLPGVISAANQAAAAKAKLAADKTAATRAAVQNEFGTGASSQQALQNTLGARAQDHIGKANARTDAIQQALQSGKDLSNEDLKILGISRDDLNALNETSNQIKQNSLFGPDLSSGAVGFDFAGTASAPQSQGLDLAQFIKRQNPANNINAQNVATADEYAKYQALNQLMGTNGSFLGNPSMANTASQDAADFDLQSAKDYLSKTLAERQKGMNGLKNLDFSYKGPTPGYRGM